MSQITWADKVTLDAQPDIARMNKVIDEDMNEIKEAVNDNYSKIVPTITTDANGWTVADHTFYKEYTKVVQETQNFSASTWGSLSYISLPVDLSTLGDAILTYSAGCTDAAVSLNAYAKSTEDHISRPYVNHYTGAVQGVGIIYNFRIIKYNV